MGRFIDIGAREWKQVRPDVAHGVLGTTILDETVTMTVTRVVPGSGFAAHHDAYGHLLYFLSGSGVVGVAGEETAIRPGLAVRIRAGEEHYYRNTGTDELTLISVNIPEGER
ncbi:cupin domain-containing protein [Oryzomonas sagensis]|uniref:Cupin domain-containing protein n=1 Tax=Oryzomonas sagensis TaxID=2603857 RepID=A0ABQ6TTM9_9BACT|nr:cupin domain-containing protein [Oryzomonas sagensis]KAB0672182.1 cupin domain-containing protein [Oryzomonas sagensis]